MAAPDRIKELRDDVASTAALIDQAQAHFDANRANLTEDQAWHVQADIDIRRFQLEIAKLQINTLEELGKL